MITALFVVTLVIVLWSLWTRRHTLRVKWETASTIQLMLMSVACVLESEFVGKRVGVLLHHVTHLWNVQFWVAHLCILASACAIVYNAVSRLDHPGKCPD